MNSMTMTLNEFDLNQIIFEEAKKVIERRKIIKEANLPMALALAFSTPAGGQRAETPQERKEREELEEKIANMSFVEQHDMVFAVVDVGLTLIGFAPGFGELADLAAVGVSLAREDYIGAVLSLLSAMPIAGYGTAAFKLGLKTARSKGGGRGFQAFLELFLKFLQTAPGHRKKIEEVGERAAKRVKALFEGLPNNKKELEAALDAYEKEHGRIWAYFKRVKEGGFQSKEEVAEYVTTKITKPGWIRTGMKWASRLVGVLSLIMDSIMIIGDTLAWFLNETSEMAAFLVGLPSKFYDFINNAIGFMIKGTWSDEQLKQEVGDYLMSFLPEDVEIDFPKIEYDNEYIGSGSFGGGTHKIPLRAPQLTQKEAILNLPKRKIAAVAKNQIDAWRPDPNDCKLNGKNCSFWEEWLNTWINNTGFKGPELFILNGLDPEEEGVADRFKNMAQLGELETPEKHYNKTKHIYNREKYQGAKPK